MNKPPAGKGRPKSVFKLERGHPLSESHLIVRRHKWGVTVLSGAPPPKRPRHGGETLAGRRALRDFARYFVSNYVPWRHDRPPTLTYVAWTEWESRLAEEADAREEDGSETYDADRAGRRLAAARLFMLENVIDGFTVRRSVANVLNKHRARHRTLWKDLAGGAPKGASNDIDAEQRTTSQALDRIRAKAARLDGEQDIVTRMKTASKMEAWSAALCADLPSGNINASAVAKAGAGLRGQWGEAAHPTKRVVAVDVRAVNRALRLPLPPREAPADTVPKDSGDNSRASVRQPTPLPAALMPMTDAEYDAAAASYARDVAAGAKGLKPPLTPEQRKAAGPFLQAVQMRSDARQLGWSPVEIDAAIREAKLAPVTLLVGPGGAGKSAVVHEIEAHMQSMNLGFLLVTAYTGVAVVPFGGPTLMNLLSLNLYSKKVVMPSLLTGGNLEEALRKFYEVSGMRLEDIGAIVVDEVSFVELRLFGHADMRFRALTGVLGLPFGGIPLLLAGDNFQKPPPANSGWYRTLVESACTKTVAEGPLSAGGRALTLLKAARRVVLARMMRAKEDPTFVDALSNMRRPDIDQPVTDEFVAGLRTVSAADLAQDETWRFAPIGVLSQPERNAINHAQVYAFARAFNLPLVRWRRQLLDPQALDRMKENLNELYDHEPELWTYFVEGAPVNLTDTIMATRKLVNGTPGLLDSLSFRDGTVPEALAAAYDKGVYVEVTLDEPPLSVNVRVGSKANAARPSLWHGVPLDDLEGLIESVAGADAQVVPIMTSSRNPEDITLRSVFAAQTSAPCIVDARKPGFMYAFALTDFKLQGRTLDKLILSICTRPCPPWLKLVDFYVLVSRVRFFNALRLLFKDKQALQNLTSLQHDVYLEAWDNSYDSDGMWSDTLAVKALSDAHSRRLAASIATEASRTTKAKASRPGAGSKASGAKASRTGAGSNTSVAADATPTAVAKRPPKRRLPNDPRLSKRLCSECRKPGHTIQTCAVYKKRLVDQQCGPQISEAASTSNRTPFTTPVPAVPFATVALGTCIAVRPITAPAAATAAATAPATATAAAAAAASTAAEETQAAAYERYRHTEYIDTLARSAACGFAPLVTHDGSIAQSPDDRPLPDWLQNAYTSGLILKARVVDFWSGSVTTRHALTMWLRGIGFDVTVTSNLAQIGVSCGNVAARASALMFAAGADLCTVDVSDAVEQQWIDVCNDMSMFDESVRDREHVSAGRSWLLCSDDIYFLTHEIRVRDHPAERLHDVPDIPCQSWPLMVGGIDLIECCVAESVRTYASSSTDAQPSREFFVTNTQTSKQQGEHWIAVAIDMSWQSRM